MSRKPGIYIGHESARMAELEGAPLASFTARAIAFMIDFAMAAVSFVALGMAGALAVIKLGWRRGDVHVEFAPFITSIGKASSTLSFSSRFQTTLATVQRLARRL